MTFRETLNRLLEARGETIDEFMAKCMEAYEKKQRMKRTLKNKRNATAKRKDRESKRTTKGNT